MMRMGPPTFDIPVQWFATLPTSYEVKLVQVGDISEQSPSLTLILQKGKFMLLCVGKMFHLKTT